MQLRGSRTSSNIQCNAVGVAKFETCICQETRAMITGPLFNTVLMRTLTIKE